VVRDYYQKAGVLSKYRKGGRWSEKDFTLTLPDAHPSLCGDDAVERRIDVLFDAWPLFLQRLNAHLRKHAFSPKSLDEPLSEWPKALIREQKVKKDCLPKDALRRILRGGVEKPGAEFGVRLLTLRVANVRSFEWTPGHDGQGHPHFHVWFWGPFLDTEKLREWWAESLTSCGVKVQPEELVHAYLREVKSKWIVKEVIKGKDKYTTRRLKLISERADADGSHPFSYVEGWHVDFKAKHGGKDADALTQARVFMALEKRRTTQASFGFLGLGEQLCSCPSCSALLFQDSLGAWQPVLASKITNWRDARERAPPVEAPSVIRCSDDGDLRQATKDDLAAVK
jgi:hypothetical protein